MKKVGCDESIIELSRDDFAQTFSTDYFEIKNNRNVYDHHKNISKKRVFISREAYITQN